MAIINLRNLEEYKAQALSYDSGSCNIKNNYYLPPNSMNFIPTFQEVGLRSFGFSVEYKGDNEEDVVIQSSRLTSVLSNKDGVVVNLGDGFHYFGLLNSVSSLEIKTPNLQTQRFSLLGYRRGKDPIVTPGQETINLKGNFRNYPVFNVVVSTVGGNLNDLVFKSTGEFIIDSLKKTVTRGGFNAMDQVSLYEFPYMEPGENHFTFSGLLFYITYYPLYF